MVRPGRSIRTGNRRRGEGGEGCTVVGRFVLRTVGQGVTPSGAQCAPQTGCVQSTRSHQHPRPPPAGHPHKPPPRWLIQVALVRGTPAPCACCGRAPVDQTAQAANRPPSERPRPKLPSVTGPSEASHCLPSSSGTPPLCKNNTAVPKYDGNNTGCCSHKCVQGGGLAQLKNTQMQTRGPLHSKAYVHLCVWGAGAGGGTSDTMTCA